MRTVFFEYVTDIPVSYFLQNGIDCVFLDVDNTLRSDKTAPPVAGIKRWLRTLKQAEIRVVLCSNNFKSALQLFARELETDFIGFCLKPSPFLLLRAKKRLGFKIKNSVIIGDQVFTDILFSKICGMKSILVNPISCKDERVTVKFRRAIMRPFEKRIRSNRFDEKLKEDEL